MMSWYFRLTDAQFAILGPLLPRDTRGVPLTFRPRPTGAGKIATARTYRDRNAIERMFGRIKDFRRIATRYDRLAQNFRAALCLVAPVC